MMQNDFGLISIIMAAYNAEKTMSTAPAAAARHLRHGICGTASALPKCSIRHPVLSALLAWHLPHLARRIDT